MSNYTTFLRWGVLGALFAALVVPFIIADGGAMYSSLSQNHNLYLPVQNLFFPYITGKNFAFRIFVEFAALGYLLLALRVPKYRPKGSVVMWAVVALVAWMGIATLASVDPGKSFWSNFERMDGYIDLIHLAVWFVITGAVLTADGLWSAFLETAVGASVVQGIVAFCQVMHVIGFAPSSQSGARADGTFGNATYLAVYMLFSIFITLYVMARRLAEGRMRPTTQAYYGIALVLQVLALYLTETRGAQLGLIVGLVIAALWVAVFAAREHGGRTLRRAAFGVLGVVLVLVVGFVALRNTSFVRNSSALSRLASVSLNDTTISARIKYIWPTALAGIAEKPLTGWGYENFNYVFNEHYQPAMYNQESWFDRAHNEFLDFAVWGGVPALVLYIALFGAAVWTIWRARLGVAEQAALMGLLAAYAFNNLAVFDNLVSYMYFFAILALVHGYAPARPPRFVAWARPVGEHGLAVVAPVMLIALGFVGWYFNAPGLARASALVNALSAQGSPQANLTYFSQALSDTTFPGNSLGRQEAAEQLAQFTVGTVAQSSIDPSIKQQFTTLASGGLEEAIAARPHDARLELFMGSLLASTGANNQAVEELKQAQADSPQKQQILFQLGLLQIQTGDMAGAIATMQTAFNEEPSYDTARVMLAGAYYYAGQTAKGDQLLIDKWGTTIVDNDQLLSIYDNLKMYARSEAIWQLRIKQSPNDVNLYLRLAQTYFNAGDKANTIATLKKVEQVQPADAGQIEQLITQINNGTLKPQ